MADDRSISLNDRLTRERRSARDDPLNQWHYGEDDDGGQGLYAGEHRGGGPWGSRGQEGRIQHRAFDTLGGGMIPLMDKRYVDVETAKEEEEKRKSYPRVEERGFDTLGGGEIPWIDRRRSPQN